jgi:hypothetical protein
MFASHLVGPAAPLRHTSFLAEVHHECQLAQAVDGLASRRRRLGWAIALHTALRTMQSLPAGRIRLAAAQGRHSSCGNAGARERLGSSRAPRQQHARSA